ncbi:hypothetical protein RDI61_28490 [Pseudomonas plecoglossicida]|jgi:hypothetical protein|uniref:Uncharacterized protein n=1 Tax=Pseudomonas putida TRO1 TaxID=1227924 RepID=A0AAD2W632_PSEPU|nr:MULTISPECIES: hypothetical protein [Pseudomonas]ELS0922342.1 hypothetical protein [Pseudomonas putida]ENY74697.1 hypothetical protein C206_25990 [Pseudomonas putida TRO1]MCE0907365.1 hypothetical protein [Pseudomonas alloputida]MCF1250489.1 hypothetical protein [Pseudomonas putida]MCX2690330.1 hypothetical protein [Pseudomonas sp. DCB_BZ]
MLVEDLKRFKDEVVKKAEDSSFVLDFDPDCAEASNIKWSKGVGISFIPYELEMSGVKPSRLTAKEPTSKKNINKYYYVDGRLQKVDIYNAKGEIHGFEYFFYDDRRDYSIKMNRHGERLWLKVIDKEQGEVRKACRVDFDSEFWTLGYDWNQGRLQEILTFSSNSLPGIKIYPVFEEGDLVGLFTLRGEEKIYIYDER